MSLPFMPGTAWSKGPKLSGLQIVLMTSFMAYLDRLDALLNCPWKELNQFFTVDQMPKKSNGEPAYKKN